MEDEFNPKSGGGARRTCEESKAAEETAGRFAENDEENGRFGNAESEVDMEDSRLSGGGGAK